MEIILTSLRNHPSSETKRLLWLAHPLSTGSRARCKDESNPCLSKLSKDTATFKVLGQGHRNIRVIIQVVLLLALSGLDSWVAPKTSPMKGRLRLDQLLRAFLSELIHCSDKWSSGRAIKYTAARTNESFTFSPSNTQPNLCSHSHLFAFCLLPYAPTP